MIARQIRNRGTLLTFDDDISLYLIHGFRSYILCDTHCGPESMDEIFSFIDKKSESARMVIFNSHSDWDHIWGNCSFPGSIRIGHEICRRRMQERGELDLMQNSSQQRGAVVITLPNLTFSDRLTLEDEGIEFSYAPGHTIDSAVCYDCRDNVLYLGDLVEDPIPYLDAEDLDIYITTLRALQVHPAEVLITAHSGVVTRDLITRNLSYIERVKDGVQMDPAGFGTYRHVHQWNLNMRVIWEYLRTMHRMSGGNLYLLRILEKTGDLHEIRPHTLKELLYSCIEV